MCERAASLVDPDAPHADDDEGVAGDEEQIGAEEQEVQDVAHVAPLVLHGALPLQLRDVRTDHVHVLADLAELRHRHGQSWQGSRHCRHTGEMNGVNQGSPTFFNLVPAHMEIFTNVRGPNYDPMNNKT